MTARTFDELFETKPVRKKPPVRLTLEESRSGYYTAVDEYGEIYSGLPTRDMDKVIQHMRAMAFKGDAVLDEESITWFRALRQFGEFSVRADAFKSERGTEEGEDLPVATPVGGAGLTAPVPQAATVEREPTPPLSEIGVVAALPQGAAAAGDKAAAPMHLRLVN